MRIHCLLRYRFLVMLNIYHGISGIRHRITVYNQWFILVCGNSSETTKMHRFVIQPKNFGSLRVLQQQSLHRMGSKCSQIGTGHLSSPVVFPEKKGKINALKQSEAVTSHENPDKVETQETRIDIDELSDLVVYDVFSGKLALVKKSKSTSIDEQSVSGTLNSAGTDAKLTSKALSWGSQTLLLEDVVSVSYYIGLRYFTVHAYPLRKRYGGFSCILKPKRSQKNFRFLASNSEEAILWITGFADQQCFVKCSPHPLASSTKKSAKDLVASDPLFDQPFIKCKSPPKILVILNPRSGHGRSSKVFHGKVEPIFELAGFKMEVVKTTAAGHARKLAATVDINTCPDGIVCVGGDGIVNEVLNGLLNRDDKKEALSVPIGIIPAGSDNSLVWTVLGIRDAVTAALSIVRGALTATDVFALEWIQTGVVHYGSTASYFGFLSDVLELSEKYQKRFGPLRYFIAGFLKFLCLPKYSFELEYLPVTKEVQDEEKAVDEQEKFDMSDPKSECLSSIDSTMSPSRMPEDLGMTCNTLASSEPSEIIRGLDPKSERLSSGKNDLMPESEEVIHPRHHFEGGMLKEPVPELDEKWVVKEGKFLGILVCNHSCKTVQSLSSQVVAPRAEHDDNCLDLLLVHGSGRLRLLKFFIFLQFGQHLSLPYVEYVKVKSVKIKATRNTNNGCGVDGELIRMNGQVICSLLPEHCHLIGRPARELIQLN